jgi:hypothetical protein
MATDTRDEEPASARPDGARRTIALRYFEDVLEVEFAAINARRERRADHGRDGIQPLIPESPKVTGSESEGNSPDPARLFGPGAGRRPPPKIDPKEPVYSKTRPRPVPCDAKGLAFSGGGIRSAAVCLGALQALKNRRRIEPFDYLSTVSGGGYIGACLSAAMGRDGGGLFPFGEDISDSPAIAHLRNYSNYLMPRGRSFARNASEAAAIILRGLLANVVVVMATLLLCVLLTLIAYPSPDVLGSGSFLARLFPWLGAALGGMFARPFGLTLLLLVVLATVLIAWAVLRSFSRLDGFAGDTASLALAVARSLLGATLVVAFLDLQPVLLALIDRHYDALVSPDQWVSWVNTTLAGAIAFAGGVSLMSSTLGRFLKTTQHDAGWTILLRRGAAHLVLVVAALVLPLALWILYLFLTVRAFRPWEVPSFLAEPSAGLRPYVDWLLPSQNAQVYGVVFLALFVVTLGLRANGYSLHRFYRDRLSRAFVFGRTRDGDAEPHLLDFLKLSSLRDSLGPYHIINAAMNVQGSKEANRRGRNADFFMFTRDFVGSDLTLYGPTRETLLADTKDMEAEDSRLDLATAMAISGAAVSANMGANTVRLLSPTLALLNIRLGYWLHNPRVLATDSRVASPFKHIGRALFGKFYLLLEMLNQLDEKSSQVYLSDGGHIENLGVYELLKRGCQLIVVIDAEADPAMSFGSLLKLERYARIDLGVRISLPWEAITQVTQDVAAELANGFPARRSGPHCAVGRIDYENGAQGIMIYFKSSLTGDEKDYILDYKRRSAAFPHETTGDQFFTEEQFEAYRALGFHMVDGFFGGNDTFSFLTGPGGFQTAADAKVAVDTLLQAMDAPPPPPDFATPR